jgi:hypothetical protein
LREESLLKFRTIPVKNNPENFSAISDPEKQLEAIFISIPRNQRDELHNALEACKMIRKNW